MTSSILIQSNPSDDLVDLEAQMLKDKKHNRISYAFKPVMFTDILTLTYTYPKIT